MRERHFGRIVNISSVNALEGASHNITANAIAWLTASSGANRKPKAHGLESKTSQQTH